MRPLMFCLTLAVSPAFADASLQDLGEALFFDPSLSINGTQSCASCHDPASGFSAGDVEANLGGGVVQGAIVGQFGNRKPPTIAYTYASPALHHTIEDGAPLFMGGLFFDGRAAGNVTGSVLADQAMQPMLNPAEMAMPDPASVVARACETHAEFAARVGEACALSLATAPLEDEAAGKVDQAFALLARAIAAYEASPEVNRFSSRYDAFVAGQGTLSAQELAGLELFNTKGKCSACHITDAGPSGEGALFTDFTYDNLGVPRNPANPYYEMAANPLGADWVDLGVGPTLAADLIYAPLADDMMGKVKVPTLRNVDARATPDAPRAYTHNGYFKTLAGVVRFYNTRDVWPACAGNLPEAEALAQRCWPKAEVPATVNRDELGNLKLTEVEEAAIVAFLQTLTDR